MKSDKVLIVAALAAWAWACDAKVDVGSVGGPDAGTTLDAALDAVGNPRGDDAGAEIPDATAEDATPMGAQLVCNGPDVPPDGSCHATCCTPAGAVAGFATVDDLYAAIAGRWQFCSQQNLKNTFGAPPDSVGIEFVLTDPGDASCSEAASGACGRGNVYYLVQGPSGPVRGAGFDYQLTFNAFPVSGGLGGSTYQLDLTTTGSYLTHIRYSPCPTEIGMTGDGVDTPVLLVPFY